MVECIKGLDANLKSNLLGHRKLALQGQVERLSPRTVKRISSHISKSEGGWCGKRRRIKPTGGRMRAGTKDRMVGGIGADWILAQHRAGLGRITKDRAS